MNRKEKTLLESQCLESIRAFFRNEGYLEVETPYLVESPGQELHLSPFTTELLDIRGTSIQMSLATSPEYSMKKLLGEGLERIFTIAHAYRNQEPYTDTASAHQPEFLMLEWYAQKKDYVFGMDETQALIQYIADSLRDLGYKIDLLPEFTRLHLPTEFQKRFNIDLSAASTSDLANICASEHIHTDPNDSWSDLFHRIFVTKIEPEFGKGGVFVYDFPKQQAALSRLTKDGKYAERFECYLNGQEICNAFTELTDVDEQRKRFLEEQTERKRQGKPVFPIDEELLSLLSSVHNPTFGNALGISRLLMALLKVDSIEDVVPFPINEQRR